MPASLEWETVFGLLIQALMQDSTGNQWTKDAVSMIAANPPVKREFREWFAANCDDWPQEDYSRKYILSALLDD